MSSHPAPEHKEETQPNKAPPAAEKKANSDKQKQKTKDATQKSLKEQKRLQKQAQRAARKEQMATAGGGQAPSNDNGHNANSAPGGNAGSHQGAPSTAQGSQAFPSSAAAPAGSHSTNIVSNLFSGIDHPKTIVSKNTVHPSILHLALQMQNCRLIGSTRRCRAMLVAFRDVIRDYETPPDSTLSRSLAVHYSHQIEVLKSGRDLSVSMGNAIRWLKQETSQLDVDLSDNAAKDHLIKIINLFIRDRIDMANRIIVDTASIHIRGDSDVILTYGSSQVVTDTLVNAYSQQKKNFRVIVADSPPLFEGKRTASDLVAAGIPTTYIMMTALPYVMKGVTTLMVGAHAMVSNGNLYSRVGTSMVAVMASARSIPVLVLCETIKFSDRVQLDAFAVNEFVPETDAKIGTNSVFFDLTDQSLISKVVTEVGALPASSVPVILREYKQVL